CLYVPYFSSYFFFFLTLTPTPEIYTLSLHDALPISTVSHEFLAAQLPNGVTRCFGVSALDTLGYESMWAPVWLDTPRPDARNVRSEEHTSELQSPCNLVCRLLLEKKKIKELTSKSSS